MIVSSEAGRDFCTIRYGFREGTSLVFAITGNFSRIRGIVTVGAAILLPFWNHTVAGWMRAHSFDVVGHKCLLP